MTRAPHDLLRARLGREWTVTVEVVTPAPEDAAARARILTLADAVGADPRVAALTLTDRTISPAADPVAFAPAVIERVGPPPLVHLAGKGRSTRELEASLRRAAAAGVGSVLLTGGDPWPAGEGSAATERAGEGQGAHDSLHMLAVAGACVPHLTRLAVLTLPRSLRGAVSWERASAKRAAGADAFIAQVTWDLSEREIVADRQARLGAPILGAVMPLTRGRLTFLAAHRITGIVVPPALAGRVADESPDMARRRLALDLVLLRRLGYAGAHVSGIVTPARLAGVLDEAAALDAALGADWREVWRSAVGIH